MHLLHDYPAKAHAWSVTAEDKSVLLGSCKLSKCFFQLATNSIGIASWFMNIEQVATGTRRISYIGSHGMPRVFGYVSLRRSAVLFGNDALMCS